MNNRIPKLERCKIIFQYSLVIVVAILCGYLFIGLVSEDVLMSVVEKVSYHFEIPFIECSEVYEIFEIIWKFVFSDIACVIVLFISSFTIVNYLISDFVLLYIGFNFGASLSILVRLFEGEISNVRYTPGAFNSLLFIFTRLVYIILIFWFCLRIAGFSYNLKSFNISGRVSVSIPILLVLVITTLVLLFTIVLLKGLYCLLIYNF